MIKLKNISLLVLSLGFMSASVVAQENDVVAKEKKGAINFKSNDGQYNWSFGGRVYMDGVYYMEDATDLSSKTSLSDVRLYGKASWGKWDAKINFSFANNKVHAKDIYLNYSFSKNSSIRVGNFFEPFGIQGSISSKDSRFIGNSFSGEAFSIGRSVGIAYTTFSDKYFLSGGVFGGRIGNDEMGDAGYSATAKAVYSPIVKEGMTFHIGASASYRLPDANGFDEKYNDDDYNREVVYAAGPEHKFLNAHIAHAGNELKLNAEVLATYGRFMVQSEYYTNKVYRKSNYDLQFAHSRPDMWGWSSTEKGFEDWYGVQRDIEMDGYYVQAGFLVKGGDYSYNAATAYINRPKAGSLELLARINKTNLNDIDGIFMQDKFWDADPLKAAAGQTNFSVGGGESIDWALGVNYYVSNNVMFRVNYTSMDIDNLYYRQDENVSFLKARIQVNF
ncbi:MAG: OprO/OprP family phosphate-selective porin [Marinifilaceae bacterium]